MNKISNNELKSNQRIIELSQEKTSNKWHHRLLQAILAGNDSVNCTIDKTELSDNGTIPLDPMADGDFYGLDASLENGWLINRL